MYMLIPASMTLMSSQGHRVIGKLGFVQSFCWKVAWNNSSVHDGWLEVREVTVTKSCMANTDRLSICSSDFSLQSPPLHNEPLRMSDILHATLQQNDRIAFSSLVTLWPYVKIKAIQTGIKLLSLVMSILQVWKNLAHGHPNASPC